MGTQAELLVKRTGRPENLKKGKRPGEPPSRKLSEQKVKDFCLYYLTHSESTKAAGLSVGLSPTYVYEFFKKPLVQAMLEKLRSELDAKLLDEAAKRRICDAGFLDENLAPIIRNPYPHPKRGFADQISAARLAAEIAGLAGVQRQAPVLNAQIIQNSILGSDVYMPSIDRQRLGINDPRSREIEGKLLGPSSPEAAPMGAKDARSDEGTE
jgi:hypothetical protein